MAIAPQSEMICDFNVLSPLWVHAQWPQNAEWSTRRIIKNAFHTKKNKNNLIIISESCILRFGEVV